MVLSRLQNGEMPFASPYDSQGGADASNAINAPTPPDFHALLASIGAAANNGSSDGYTLDPSMMGGDPFASSSQVQQPFVSADQLHPQPTANQLAPTSSNGKANKGTKRRDRSPSEDQGDRGEGSSAAGAAASTGTERVPPFLNKLRSMVDDADDDLICWTPDGKAFRVLNSVRFAKEVLPCFFKHSNFSSFVRQLNMYSFRKVPSLQQGSLRGETEMEVWEFENDQFIRDRPELMSQVQRKRGHKVEGQNAEKDDENDRKKADIDGRVEEGLNSVSGALTRATESESLTQLANVWQAIQSIQTVQTGINDNLRHLHMANDSLWQETMEQKRRSEQQADTINRMLRFLAGVFGGPEGLAKARRAADGGDRGTPSRTAGRDRSGQGDNNNAHRGLFRSGSNRGPLLIQASEQDGGNEADNANSNQIEELFSRFSEPGSNETTPRATSPQEERARFTSVKSDDTSRPGSPNTASTPNTSSTKRAGRPPRLGELERRPSTPSRGANSFPGNQLMAALQMLANSQGDGSGNTRPGTPFANRAATPGTPGSQQRLDPNFVASLQGLMTAIQQQQGDQQQGSSYRPQNSEANQAAAPSASSNNRFNFPYDADGQLNSSQGESPFSQWLSNTNQDADGIQQAIDALVQAMPGLNAGNGGAASGDVASSGVANGTPSYPTSGDWSQYANAGASGFNNASPAATAQASYSQSDNDVSSLFSQYLNSPGPTSASINPFPSQPVFSSADDSMGDESNSTPTGRLEEMNDSSAGSSPRVSTSVNEGSNPKRRKLAAAASTDGSSTTATATRSQAAKRRVKVEDAD